MKPSKKTTTILNRFTTYIPTWWAKATILLPILFFLIACEEEVSTLGFKSGQDKFKVYYAEIPVISSVLWMDSLRTTNLSGETSRLLAGSYIDPVFGSTQAQALMHFTSSNITTPIPATAIYDSIVFQMRFDFYSYGSTGETAQTFAVHEITEELDLKSDYFFNSDVDVAPNELGVATVNVNYEVFKEEFEKATIDSVLTLKVKLSNSFGQRLFDAVDPEDVNYTDFELFKAAFKGLAIIPQQSDKIVGFKPSDLNSSLILYYHNGDTKSTLSFIFSQGVNFSKFISDRSSTELSGLSQFHTDFDPGLKRYVQGGTSIVTKMDFSKYYEYIDTIPNMMINSAELEISEVETSSTLKAPKSLTVSMLRSNNRFKTIKTEQDSIDYINFNGKVTIAEQLKFFIAKDEGSTFSMDYSSTNNTYNGFPTLFFQQLFKLKSEEQYPFWTLRPGDPQPGKSVDRLVFPKDKLKLKIYYTRSTLDNQ